MRNITVNLSKPAQWLENIASGMTLLMPLSMFIGSAASDVLLSLIGFLFAINCAIQRDFSAFRQNWVRVASLLWLYLILRSCFVDVPAQALGRSVPWIRFVFFALALQTWILNNVLRRQRLLWATVAAVSFAIADTLWQYHSGFDILNHPKWGDARLTGSLRWPTDGISLHWLGVPLMTVAIQRLVDKVGPLYQRLGLGVGVLLLLTTIVMTGDRAAFLLSILAIGGALICYPRAWKVVTVIGLTGCLAIAGFLATHPAQLKRQLSTIEDLQHFAHSPYGNVWRGGIAVFKHAPIFGVGLKHYRHVCVKYETLNPQTGEREGCNIHPHNLHLEWLAESGLVGWMLFMVMAGCWLKQLWQRRSHWLVEPAAVGAVLIVLIRLLPIVPSASFFVAWAAVPLWLMLGWGLAASS